MKDEKFFVDVEVKELDEDGAGTFTGIASVMDEEDLGGDIIERGAFKKSLADSPVIPVLWQHDQTEVIGEGRVSQWQNKLMIRAKLDLEDPTAAKAHRKLKNKLVKGLSIGFQSLRHSWEEIEGRMVRRIQELKLFEVSIVTFPMMPSAQVTRVKSADDALLARMERAEQEIRELRAASAEQRATSDPTDAGEGAAAANPPSPPPANDHGELKARLEKIRRILEGQNG